MPEITPFLWFESGAEEAARFYTSVFPRSRITEVARMPPGGPGPEGSVLTVAFELDGKRFVALNGGPQYRFSPATSFVVDCADQAEVDHYWRALGEEGGKPGPCGWLDDRYGVTWQIVPKALYALLSDPDPGRAGRATRAMLGMSKLDLAGLRAAADAA